MMTRDQYHHGDLPKALIHSAIELLKTTDVSRISLRAVAREAGVSHSAPYAHFADKRALLAAISAESFRELHDQISHIVKTPDLPADQMLSAVARDYLDFALENPQRFKLMFSNNIGEEHEYPELTASTSATFNLLKELVQKCQEEGVLKPGSQDAVAVALWSLVHGFLSLYLENQFSHQVLADSDLSQLLEFCIQQIQK